MEANYITMDSWKGQITGKTGNSATAILNNDTLPGFASILSAFINGTTSTEVMPNNNTGSADDTKPEEAGNSDAGIKWQPIIQVASAEGLDADVAAASILQEPGQGSAATGTAGSEVISTEIRAGDVNADIDNTSSGNLLTPEVPIEIGNENIVAPENIPSKGSGVQAVPVGTDNAKSEEPVVFQTDNAETKPEGIKTGVFMQVDGKQDSGKQAHYQSSSPADTNNLAGIKDIQTSVSGVKFADVQQNVGNSVNESGAVPRTLSENVIYQVIQRISMTSIKDKTEVRIKLQPELLGEIRIKLTVENGQLTARLSTATHIARDAIENGLPQLKHIFQSQGFDVDSLSVNVGSHNEGGGNDGDGGGAKAQTSKSQEIANNSFETAVLGVDEDYAVDWVA